MSEWAKKQLEHRGIRYEALDNGFFSCEDHEELQQICDSFGADQIETFFRKWLRRLPPSQLSADSRQLIADTLSYSGVKDTFTHSPTYPLTEFSSVPHQEQPLYLSNASFLC